MKFEEFTSMSNEELEQKARDEFEAWYTSEYDVDIFYANETQAWHYSNTDTQNVNREAMASWYTWQHLKKEVEQLISSLDTALCAGKGVEAKLKESEERCERLEKIKQLMTSEDVQFYYNDHVGYVIERVESGEMVWADDLEQLLDKQALSTDANKEADLEPIKADELDKEFCARLGNLEHLPDLDANKGGINDA